MKLDTKDLSDKLLALGKHARRYMVLIFILIMAAAYGFLVFRIGTLAQSEPSESAVTEQLQTVKRPKIDQGAIDRIQTLEDSNIEVKALFDQARQNPFQE